MGKDSKFIMTPITSVIEDMVTATNGLSKGIETYPLWDYILQSTFIKMTGFQEQKMKCIDWELANNDYEYRRIFLNGSNNKGEYSDYDAKRQVFNALLDGILKLTGSSKEVFYSDYCMNMMFDPKRDVLRIIENTKVVEGKQREYNYFIRCDKEFSNQYFVLNTSGKTTVLLFQNMLQKRYEELYKQRNRIAHNVISFQDNLPKFSKLVEEDELSRNYFFWFSILVLIDEIFMELYKKYTESLGGDSFFNNDFTL